MGGPGSGRHKLGISKNIKRAPIGLESSLRDQKVLIKIWKEGGKKGTIKEMSERFFQTGQYSRKRVGRGSTKKRYSGIKTK
jgi:hypothetical protein